MALAVRPSARAYNFALLAWLLLLLLLWGAGLLCLERSGRLPAPPLTATGCIDEKFKSLRQFDLSEVTLAAVGSSVTTHSLDVGLLRQQYGPGAKPMNVAPCYLRMNQIAFLTEFYLEHMPRVHTVFSALAMRDVTECAANPTEFFDPRAAAEYVFERRSVWWLYFKNFRPVPFFQFVLQPAAHREHMNAYGWVPLRQGPPLEDMLVDADCFAPLRRLSDNLAALNISLRDKVPVAFGG